MGDAVGKKIRRLRRLADMTQQELADKVGVTSSAVQAWECGRAKPRVDKLEEVAAVFKVPSSELLDDSLPATTVLGPEFSWDERELLDAYRLLPADMKLMYLADICELAREYRGGGFLMSLLLRCAEKPRGLRAAPRLVAA